MKLASSLKSPDSATNPHLLSLEFLTDKDSQQAMRLVVKHLVTQGKLSIDEYELSNVESHFERFMGFVVEKNTSFILKSEQGKVMGLSLNLDIKDLLNLFETTINFSVFESLGLFTKSLKNWAYKIADCRKGDFLFNILTVFQQHQLGIGRKIDYVLRAMAFCQIIGWKSLLYPTQDPFFFLKLGGQIFELLKNSSKLSSPIKKQHNAEPQINTKRDLQPKLDLIPYGEITYVLIMRMQKLKFVNFEYDKDRIGQAQNIIPQDGVLQTSQKNQKLCIMPKL